MRRAANAFWFRPASPLGIIAVRFIVAANALWIVLSRPQLPSIAGWPAPFWTSVGWLLRARFLLFAPPSIEYPLYGLLILCLLGAMFGVAARFSCLAAGVLLYHFAPFENVFWHAMGPYFSGLTLPTLALLIFGFASVPRRNMEWSPEWRWPLAAVQLLFSFNYFFAAISKVRTVGGFGWVSSENIRGMAMTSMTWETPPRLAGWVIARPWACWMIAIITMVAECLFILVPFSKVAAAILVPLAFIGHVGIVLVLGIVFLSLPCLLIYLDWDAIDLKLGKHRTIP
jgi:hypothetical protein